MQRPLTNGLALALALIIPGIAAAEFSVLPLPEPAGALGSEATSLRKNSRRASMRAGGRLIDSGGLEKPALWRAPSEAGPFSLQDVEDPLPAGSSRVTSVHCTLTDCIAVGSSGDVGSELPVLWRDDDSPGCFWCLDATLGLPPLASEASLHGGGVRAPAGGAVYVAVGSAVIQDGTPGGVRKGALWLHDGASWSAQTAPDPATQGARTIRVNGALYVAGGASYTLYIGEGDDGAGSELALVWSQPDGGAVSVPFPLPLPAFGDGARGRVLASHTSGLHAAGTVTSSGAGIRHSVVWNCSVSSCSSPADWSFDRELTPPSGLSDCEPEDMDDLELSPGDQMLDVVGQCVDAVGASVGVIWSFDPNDASSSTGGVRLADFTKDGLPDLSIERVAGIKGRGTVATGKIETGGFAPSVGSHAYFLAVTQSVPGLSLGAGALLTVALLFVSAIRAPRD